MLSMTNFPALIREAHGCEMPQVVTTYREFLGDLLYYDCTLPKWGVTFTVVLPFVSVCVALDGQYAGFNPDLPWEHAEFYLDKYEVTAADALSCALATFHTQPEDVRKYLIQRFGPILDEARQLGGNWWEKINQS